MTKFEKDQIIYATDCITKSIPLFLVSIILAPVYIGSILTCCLFYYPFGLCIKLFNKKNF